MGYEVALLLGLCHPVSIGCGRTAVRAQSIATHRDYRDFAERFIDAVLDPRQPWLVEYILTYGFPPVPTWDQIGSGALAAKMRRAIDAEKFVDEWLYDAMNAHDRDTLVARFAIEASMRRLSKDELTRLLACTDFKQLKKSLKGLAEPFKFRPGPQPPTPRQHNEALKRADSLEQILLSFLSERSRNTANSHREILTYLGKDFPDASNFLLENLPLLEACLRNDYLLKRAKTRARSRARLLAEAVAGSIHLSRMPSTAVEYLRSERRKRRRSPR